MALVHTEDPILLTKVKSFFYSKTPNYGGLIFTRIKINHPLIQPRNKKSPHGFAFKMKI